MLLTVPNPNRKYKADRRLPSLRQPGRILPDGMENSRVMRGKVEK